MAASSRYDGKPLLRLLELYVLWAIGELPQAEQDKLNGMAPKLQAIYGGGGQWHDAIAARLSGCLRKCRQLSGKCGQGISKSHAPMRWSSRPRSLRRCSLTRIS